MAPIHFNGQEYPSVEAMPPEVRQLYQLATQLLADNDRDGVPDLAQGMTSLGAATTGMQIVMDGKVYTRLEDLPAEARQRYQQAMGRLDANQNGIPDMFEGGALPPAAAPAPAPAAASYRPPEAQVIGDAPPSATRWRLIAGLLALLLLAALLYLVLR